MSELEYALRAVGFATTVLGTCAAVPAATWQLLRQVRASVNSIANKLLRRRVTGEAHVMMGSAVVNISGTGTLTATGHAVGNSLEERLERLEKRVDVLNASQQQTAADLREEANERRRTVDELRGHVDTQVTRLDKELEKQQRAAKRIDTRALPIVLVGVALSTFTEELSLNAVVGDLAICVGLGFFFWAWSLLEQERASESVDAVNPG